MKKTSEKSAGRRRSGVLLSLVLLSLLGLTTAGCERRVSVAHAESAVAGGRGADGKGGGGRGEEEFVGLLNQLGVRWHTGASRLEVDGWVNMQRGLVEVFACAPEGKTHESVVVLDCVPSGLHAGLLALGLEPGAPVEVGTGEDDRQPTAAKVVVEVEWTDESGVEHRARAEDWIWNMQRERAMEHVDWLFTGSVMQPATGDSNELNYMANSVKSLVTTCHDATTVLENPLPSGADDTIYFANEKAVPAVGTRVKVLFRPAE